MPQVNPYDVNEVFAEMEQELIKSFKRNMSKYTDTSDMWQAIKMKDLEQYRREVAKEVSKATKQAKKLSKVVLKEEFLKGADKVDAFMKQFKLDVKPASQNEFFRLNRRKLNTMLESVYEDLDDASHAVYRQMDDVYRQTMFKAEIAKNSGVFTPEQAVDVATKDFLEKGINCIKYANGAYVNIASYAEMVVRTSGKRANMVAEGARNQEWGVHTIKITQHGSTCELCSPWQGRVLIDDVYSGGTRADGQYPLLSEAMAAGLFHPNCRHGSGTYFEGISNVPEPFNQSEVEAKYEKEQEQRYNERKIREWKRKANGSMDEGNRRKAEEKVKYWQGRQRQLISDNDWLRRKYSRESTKGIGLEKKLPEIEIPKETKTSEISSKEVDRILKANKTTEYIQTDVKVDLEVENRMLEDISGNDLKDFERAADYRKLAGGLEGEEVKIDFEEDGYLLQTGKSNFGVYDNRVILYPEDKEVYVDFVTSHGAGEGTERMYNIVSTAYNQGFDVISMTADKDSEIIGYKVWPKMGFDGNIPSSVKLPKNLSDAKRVSDLYKTPEGIKFWEDHGVSTHMTLSLDPNSEGLKKFAKYYKSKHPNV